MALKTYVGARYAPKFMGKWDKTNEYGALSVVYTNNQSYVARQAVPANTEITNTKYWIVSSDWNAQVDEYREQVEQNNTAFNVLNTNVNAYKAQTDNFFNQTMHTYNTQADMQADKTVKAGLTLMTSGKTTVGDGGGSMYQVVEETSSDAVALQNGLWAKPFEFQAYNVEVYPITQWSIPAEAKDGDLLITTTVLQTELDRLGTFVFLPGAIFKVASEPATGVYYYRVATGKYAHLVRGDTAMTLNNGACYLPPFTAGTAIIRPDYVSDISLATYATSVKSLFHIPSDASSCDVRIYKSNDNGANFDNVINLTLNETQLGLDYMWDGDYLYYADHNVMSVNEGYFAPLVIEGMDNSVTDAVNITCLLNPNKTGSASYRFRVNNSNNNGTYTLIFETTPTSTYQPNIDFSGVASATITIPAKTNSTIEYIQTYRVSNSDVIFTHIVRKLY